jgi:hypothetical protein
MDGVHPPNKKIRNGSINTTETDKVKIARISKCPQ